MKKVVLSVVAALAFSAAPAFAADMPMKAAKAPAPAAAPDPFDIAFGAAVMNDYMWRGITQSDHKASVAGYFEPRFNFNQNLQLYAGIAGESIRFPNNAAAEIDFYGGVRPTLGPVAFDVGIWYYYYPGGRDQYLSDNFGPINTFSDASFYEVYGHATWTVNDYLAVGANIWYTPSYLNTGAHGTYYSGTVKVTAPSNMLPNGLGLYLSGELGRQELGTTNDDQWVFGGVPVDLPSYTTWNVGGGFTWKVFTLDVRYSDTDLSKTDCALITGDPATSPSGESNWCGATFIAKLSADLTLGSLK
jgi:uncharacterized protein (TIGR02001 family)